MAKAIMVQGTTSNAGKSFTVAALCRILVQDGYSVAPFKSQNMALNSFITHEGLEMGRAQVMQAEAAGIEPLVAMNPILMKPNGNTGSQIIVNGEVLGNMEAKEYFAFKHNLKPKIMEDYNELASTHDIIVIEGAGSPAEINLQDDDIVNMGMARMAKAPVVIVGDIDRGGVFASLYGTIELLSDDEKAMVKGTIINKFRGDVDLLTPGLVQLEELTKVPCLGVVPYARLDIDDEDSLSERIETLNSFESSELIDIAVVRLPHLSNFTDLNPLSRFPQVSVRYIEKPEQIGHPDMLVIPGTKNTMDDLEWLQKKSLDKAIKGYASSKNGIVLGICGGYQILGQSLSDPYNVEHGGSCEGLGLLPMRTVFTTSKTRTRVEATTHAFSGMFAPLSGKTLKGYEIHMGTSEQTSDAPEGTTAFATLDYDDADKHTIDGCVSGNVMGSYCHGMFEDGTFAAAMVGLLCDRKGIAKDGFPTQTFAEYKNMQYDLLADAVRGGLDMSKVMKIIEEGL